MAFELDETEPLFFRCLAGILTAKTHFAVPDSTGTVTLTETDLGNNPNTLQSVSITGLSRRTLVFSAHGFVYGIIEQDGSRPGAWQSLAKYRNAADYLLVTEKDGLTYLLYIELKTSYKKQKYIPQLRCACGHVEHLLYLIKHFDGNTLDGIRLVNRFVKFSKIPLAKGVTAGDTGYRLPPASLNNDSPQNAFQCFVQEAQTVHVDELLHPTIA